MTRDLSVHGVGREVDLAWSGDGAAVDEDLFEEFAVSQRREHPGQLFPVQSHATGHSGRALACPTPGRNGLR